MLPPTWYPLPILFAITQAQHHKYHTEPVVIGEPDVVCEADTIQIYVKTRDVFVGNMYVRNKFKDPKCRASFQNNQHTGAVLFVKLGDCEMNRIERKNPSGVNYTLDVVVSVHPVFETRNDQAYAVGCFYKSEELKVDSSLKFNNDKQFTPTEVFINGVVENRCDYSIRVESVSGPLVHYSEIGQPVVHRWACEDKHLGILVKDCVAQSELFNSAQVIDNRGCPVSDSFDKLVYNDDLTMAFVQIETFKFPDANTIQFACNISFCEKINGGCLGISPPNCPIIRPSEFVPHSNVDTNVDPTRVYAPLDYLMPKDRSPLFQTTRRFNLFQQITAATNSPIMFLPRQKDYVKNDGPNYVEVLPAKQFPIIAPIASQPRAQALHSSTDSPYLLLKKNRTATPMFRPLSNERNVRARREDTTLSVKAETVFVSDSSLSAPRKRSIPMPNGEEDIGLCLNKKTSTILILLLALLGVFSLATTLYICYDIYSTRHRRLKAQITSRRDALPTNEFAYSIKAFNAMMNK